MLSGEEITLILSKLMSTAVQYATEFTWITFVYVVSIIFIVSILSEIYTEKYRVSTKEKLAMVVLAIMVGVIVEAFGMNYLYFPIWGILSYLAVVDLKYQELPDGANLIIAILALPVIVQSFNKSNITDWTLLTGIALFLIFLAIAMVGALGGGDIKMMGAIGFYFPLSEIPQLLFFGFAAGVVHGLIVLMQKDKNLKSKFAFGPGLIVGIILTSIF